MDPIDEEEILEILHNRRITREIRADVIEHLKGKGERNVPGAVSCFFAASCFWIAQIWGSEALATGDSYPPFWAEMSLSFMPVVFVLLGYRCLVPNPRDRFLLLLAKEALLKSEETVEVAAADSKDRSSI